MPAYQNRFVAQSGFVCLLVLAKQACDSILRLRNADFSLFWHMGQLACATLVGAFSIQVAGDRACYYTGETNGSEGWGNVTMVAGWTGWLSGCGRAVHTWGSAVARLILRIHTGVPLSWCHSTRVETNGSEGRGNVTMVGGVDGLAFGLRKSCAHLGKCGSACTTAEVVLAGRKT